MYLFLYLFSSKYDKSGNLGKGRFLVGIDPSSVVSTEFPSCCTKTNRFLIVRKVEEAPSKGSSKGCILESSSLKKEEALPAFWIAETYTHPLNPWNSVVIPLKRMESSLYKLQFLFYFKLIWRRDLRCG